MNIGFDAKRITHNGTGLGNYGRFIIKVLSSCYPQNTYHLYSPSIGQERLRNQLKDCKHVSYHYPNSCFYRLFKFIWRSGALVSSLKRNKVELFHGLSNELPYGLRRNNIRSVVTIHDLIFLRYPEFYKPIDRFIYKRKFRHACLKADKIVAISEMTKRDIVHFFQVEEEKIAVVYQGCDASFTHPVDSDRKEQVRVAYGLPQRFILTVGSIESRKNLLLIVKAMKHLDEDIALVAVGRRTPYADEVEQYARENGLSDRVHLVSGVTFADLPAVYQLASLFIYPSFFEGFGIPIIEAIHSGLPVIAATGSCLEEAGGPSSIYIDPNDDRMLAEKISLVLSSPELADRMRSDGKQYVKRFSDEAIAGDMMKIYQELG